MVPGWGCPDNLVKDEIGKVYFSKSTGGMKARARNLRVFH